MNIKLTSILICAAALATASHAQAQRYQPVEKQGVWWLQNKQGQPLFSFGVCVVDTGPKWEEYDINNPSYSAFRFYPNKTLWAADAVRVLKAGGFNTVGAWSEYRSLLDVPGNDLTFTPINHMGSSAGFPWLDMWDPALVKVCDDVARDQVALLKKDPRIIGYFSDNELGWWKGALFNWIWKQKTFNTRRRTVDLFLKRYSHDWRRFSADFEVVDAKNFDELRRQGHVYLRPDGQGIGTVTEVLRMLANRYYSLCRSIVKKYDPEALYLGDRYISNYYPEVAEEAGRFCDVVSTNLNPNWTDGGYVHYHLDGLTALTHRPLMITEYYMCAKENGSGNENNHSGFPVVGTQAQRTQGFLNTTKAFLAEPSLVGAHWFQYYDEPQKGRGDGENYNFGLVDINNHRYDGLLAGGAGLDIRDLHRAAAPFRAQSASLPPTPSEAYDLTMWKRDEAFLPAAKAPAFGDLYGSWIKDGLTLAVFWSEERFAEEAFKDGKVPTSSQSTFEIEIGQSKTKWSVRLDDKAGTTLLGPDWKFVYTPGTASILYVNIPASAFGKEALAAGDVLNLHGRLVSRTRAYETTWSLQRRLGLE